MGDRLDALGEVLVGLGHPRERDALRELSEREPDLTAGVAVLDGTLVMGRYGLAPGPEVGRALRVVAEARLDEGPLSEARALEILDAALGPPAGDDGVR